MSEPAFSYLRPPADIAAWVDEHYLQPALPRLGAKSKFHGPLVRVLNRIAVDLCLLGKGPGAVVQPLAFHVEAEIAHFLRRAGRGRLSREQEEELGLLQELLTGYEDHLIQAGWLTLDYDMARQERMEMSVPQRQGPRFADAFLPALLVGLMIARGHDRAKELREKLVTDRGWGRAAWAAVLAGDDVALWVQLLRDETDPVWIIERTVIAPFALGAVPDGTAVTKDLREAFLFGVAALVWLAPAWPAASSSRPASQSDEDCPLYLDLDSWHDSMACLARCSRLLGADLPPLLRVWSEPAEPLGRILRVLDLPQRLSEEEAMMICVFCAPRAGALQGRMREPFWRHYYPPSTGGSRFWEYFANRRYDPHWLHDLAVPALWEADPDYAMVLLGAQSDGDRNQIAIALAREAVLIKDWIFAWTRLLQSPQAELAARTWARVAAEDVYGDVVGEFLFNEAADLLKNGGLWELALDELRKRIEPYVLFRLSLDEQRRPGEEQRQQRAVRLLRLVAFPTEAIEAYLEKSHAALDPELLRELGISTETLFRAWMRWYGKNPYRPGRHNEVAAGYLLYLISADGPGVLPLLVHELPAGIAPRRVAVPTVAAMLNHLGPGPWLDDLVVALGQGPLQPRQRILSRLAAHSAHEEVRRRCLKELLS